MFGAIVILWSGCLISFLSSSHQKFLKKPLKARVAWPLFAFSLLCCLWLTQQHYQSVASIMTVLANTMFMWIAIVFCHAHLKMRILPFAFTGAFACMGIVQLGAAHVV
jgi:hypothetical protein